MEIAIFPIPNCVTFPGQTVSLHVFEPRYREMVEDCVNNGRAMAVCGVKRLLEKPKEKKLTVETALTTNLSTFEPVPVVSFGTVDVIEKLPDGRLMVEVQMEQRAKIDHFKQVEPYYIAEATILEDMEQPASATQALLRAEIGARFEALWHLVKKDDTPVPIPLESGFEEFAPSNAGWSFRAPEGFFARAEGKPIKGLTLQTRLGEKTGELMITRYGLEGTPIYTLGVPGIARADLKPDLAEAKLAARLQPFRGGPAEKIRGAKLSEGAFLFFEALAPASAWDSPAALAHALKDLEVEFLAPRSLKECISARGGLRFEEVNEDLQLRRAPGVFCAGEMLDWDAPTGGFLLQASVSSGFVAGDAARRFVAPN